MVLGHEAAGIVIELGKGVKELKVGDHVVFAFLPSYFISNWSSSTM